MKVFTYFVEPASYTLDLIKNIHSQLGIPYIFIKNKSEAKSVTSLDNQEYLSEKLFFSKLIFIFNIWKNNNLIIVNGYNNYPFILTFVFNFFSFKNRYIATESDTQLKIPENILKRIIKSVYLKIIFRNKYVLGFAGGSKSHKELFRYYGMIEDRIFLMPMMVDNKKFYCDNKVFPKLFTFLYVGRVIKHKNVDALIHQFNTNFNDKDVVLRIVGSGVESDYLKTKYESNKVNFAGKLFDKNLINEFHNASCFVLPSLFEPWGLVVNEALASGLPVIATKNVGAIFDLIENKDTGFIAVDMTAFGKSMISLFSDEKLLKRYSENAVFLMRDHWNYDLYTKNLLFAIQKVKQWI
jgi:glycosyltransferase involved in cell wall biosynthesis